MGSINYILGETHLPIKFPHRIVRPVVVVFNAMALRQKAVTCLGQWLGTIGFAYNVREYCKICYGHLCKGTRYLVRAPTNVDLNVGTSSKPTTAAALTFGFCSAKVVTRFEDIFVFVQRHRRYTYIHTNTRRFTSNCHTAIVSRTGLLSAHGPTHRHRKTIKRFFLAQHYSKSGGEG